MESKNLYPHAHIRHCQIYMSQNVRLTAFQVNISVEVFALRGIGAQEYEEFKI